MWMTYGHLQADCLYTGISSGPNARYRVRESLLPFYAPVLLKHCFVGGAKNTDSIATMYSNSSTGHQDVMQGANVPHWNSVKTMSFQTRKSLKNSFRKGVLVIIWRVQVFSHKTVKVLMWQWVNVCTSVQIFNRQQTKSGYVCITHMII